MIVSRRDTSNIFSGCLAYLRDDLTAKLPEGENFYENLGIEYIVGTKEIYNAINVPYSKGPSFFEISFGNKYIFPTAYSLMGRRTPQWKNHYLKSWNFFGRDETNSWILLHSVSNDPFTFAENRTYQINQRRSFNGFKIEMIDANTDGQWALCLGQIEVFGDIYNKAYNKYKCTKQITRRDMIILYSFIITLITK